MSVILERPAPFDNPVPAPDAENSNINVKTQVLITLLKTHFNQLKIYQQIAT